MAEHPFKPLEPAVLPGNEHALREFTEFFRQEAMNPPKVNELFKIPEGLSPEWQRIFDAVASYYERQSAITRLNLISLEKRSWIMEDESLSEFEMLSTATRMKEKVCLLLNMNTLNVYSILIFIARETRSFGKGISPKRRFFMSPP